MRWLKYKFQATTFPDQTCVDLGLTILYSMISLIRLAVAQPQSSDVIKSGPAASGFCERGQENKSARPSLFFRFLVN